MMTVSHLLMPFLHCLCIFYRYSVVLTIHYSFTIAISVMLFWRCSCLMVTREVMTWYCKISMSYLCNGNDSCLSLFILKYYDIFWYDVNVLSIDILLIEVTTEMPWLSPLGLFLSSTLHSNVLRDILPYSRRRSILYSNDIWCIRDLIRCSCKSSLPWYRWLTCWRLCAGGVPAMQCLAAASACGGQLKP